MKVESRYSAGGVGRAEAERRRGFYVLTFRGAKDHSVYFDRAERSDTGPRICQDYYRGQHTFTCPRLLPH